MRITILYVFAAFALTFYGGQVCPILESLSPVELGAVTFLSFLGALILRKPGEKIFVLPHPITDQPSCQFFLDFTLIILAGIFVMIHNGAKYHIPLANLFKYFTGYITAAFFMSVDTALSRERKAIAMAKDEGMVVPPGKMFSITRKFFIVALGTTTLLVLIIALVFAKDLEWIIKIESSKMSFDNAIWSITWELVFITGTLLIMVINLIFSYSKNLKLLFKTHINILDSVTNGDLTKFVPVATKDEFGAIAGYTNAMIRGLRHRMRLISALKIAEEVQQNLLPQKLPKVPGLDISGTSLYCDELGGDYYDFLRLPGNCMGVVVTDASGHGVGAALHMTTARAFLRFGIRHYKGPADLLNHVNFYLTQDSYETGRFTTLFFLEIDVNNKSLCWVRGGHDPALLYDPCDGSFTELGGKGMALGVMEDYVFTQYDREGWSSGSVVLISTDGIRETRNEDNEMFGLERIKNIIRDNAAKSAVEIQNIIVRELGAFRKNMPREDDVTLVVIKLL